MATILFKNLLQSAGDFMENQRFFQRVKSLIQHLPSFFELLWRYRHIILRDIQSDSPEAISSNEPGSMFPVVQNLLVSYYTLHGSTTYVMRFNPGTCKLTWRTRCLFRPESPVSPYGFVVHISIYCWYHSSDGDRKTYGLPCWMSRTLDRIPEGPDSEWSRSFATEVIYPVLGSSPTKAISRILKKDQGLTNAGLLGITLDFVVILISLCPFIVQGTQDAEVLLMALATAAQRLRCRGLEDEDITEPTPQKHSRVSLDMLCVIQYAPMF